LNESDRARVFIVSFPRSGHHALMGFMKRISDLHSQYCEFYNCKTHDGKEIQCPKKMLNWRLKGLHCGAGRRVTKSHDFDLALPLRDEWKYVIQYRNPVLSIQSWYELESKKKKLDHARFAKDSLDFWKTFMDKWVFSNEGRENLLPVEYDSLARLDSLKAVAAFCEADISIPEGFSPNFKPRRNLAEIPPFMQEMEEEVHPLLDRAGIRPVFE